MRTGMNRFGVMTLGASLLIAGCAQGGRDTPARAGSRPAAAADGRAGIGSVMGAADPTFLRQYAETNRFRNGRPRSFQITPDGRRVLFLRSGPRDFEHDLYEFDAESGTERVLLTADRILGGGDESMSAEEKARRERMRESARGIASYELSEDGERILVPLSGRLFVVSRGTGVVKELRGSEGYPIDPRLSPDGRFVSCVRGGDVYVMDADGGRERRVTFDGGDDGVFNGTAEFVAQEEMDRREGCWWSPDSKHLLIQRTDESEVERVYIMDPRNPAKAPQSWRYPRPGKTNAAVTLFLTTLESDQTPRPVTWDQKKYPYLAKVVWGEHSGGPVILVQNRAQTEEVLLRVDLSTGATTTLLSERDDAWVNIDPQMPRFLEDGSFLWTTERDDGGAAEGWTPGWELELRDKAGAFVRTIVPAPMGYRSLCDADLESGEVIVVAGDEPTQAHLWRVRGMDTDYPVREPLTEEPGLYGAEFGDGGGRHGVFVQTSSPARGEPSWTVRRRDGTVMGSIASAGERPGFETGVELVSMTEDRLRCAIVRPGNFEKGMRLPVILHAYTGPHSQMVQASAERYAFAQWIADHGYIVVSIDGRGTPCRGREWERAIKGNLIDLAIEDQVRGLEALGEMYPEMDMSRVGVFGWSFGGYFSAMATMRRPDVFACGVAGAPVCDWLDYDTHYTERYLGVPSNDDDAAYKASNVLSYAGELQRPLMIIHGTADDNVYFVHSLKMSDALTRAGKDHEFVVLPGFTHMVTEPAMVEAMYGRMMGWMGEELGE